MSDEKCTLECPECRAHLRRYDKFRVGCSNNPDHSMRNITNSDTCIINGTCKDLCQNTNCYIDANKNKHFVCLKHLWFYITIMFHQKKVLSPFDY